MGNKGCYVIKVHPWTSINIGLFDYHIFTTFEYTGAHHFKSVPNKKNLDMSILKSFADNSLESDENG